MQQQVLRHSAFRFFILLGISTLLSGIGSGAEEIVSDLTTEQSQFFEAKIRPVLVEHCYRCHSADGLGTRGGLGVDSRDALLAGGESGPAIVPGNLEESILWNAINYRDYKMPPKQQLPKEVLNDFRTWIEMGAPDPRTGGKSVVQTKVTAEVIEKAKSSHWAFKPPVKQSAPDVTDKSWPKNDIDRWVMATLEANSLSHAEDADPATLVRRIYFDLIGLPPTVTQATSFVERYEANPDTAIKEEVDRLLNLPQFGEHWARHWLDVARYAESTGKEVDMTFPHAWRYRNYVIDSFNSDKPYDQFVQEQIAGDLLPTKSDEDWSENLIATGFLALGPKALIEQNPRQFQADLIDEQIDATTRVFLGLSVACARCHDHKFDPIPQTDYYALAGIFQSSETFYGGTRTLRNRQPSNLIVLPTNDPFPALEPISKAELAELKSQRDQAQKDALDARRVARQKAMSKKESPNPAQMFLSQAQLDIQVALLTNRINNYDENGKPVALCMGVQSTAPKKARVLVRGEIDQPAQEVDRGMVQVLCSTPIVVPEKSDGRLQLARWIGSSYNPVTARVMANRVWLHLIGQGLAKETDNFGISGPAPTHPELLDYLAVDFVDNGWSVKQLIRTIMTSRTYRQSSKFDQSKFEADPENEFLSRANVRRLPAESIRDAMLAISGQLTESRPKGSMIAEFGTTIIGPNGPATPPVPMAASQAAATGSNPVANIARNLRPGALRAARGRSTNFFDLPFYCRSIYLPIARNTLPRSLDVFDFAEPSMVIGQREESNTAEQALYVLNNSFVLEQSDATARELLKQEKEQSKQIQLAFRMIYGREATKAELGSAKDYVRTVRSNPSNRDEVNFTALSRLCQALYASAEFRFSN